MKNKWKWLIVLAILAAVSLVGGYLQNRGKIAPYVVEGVKEEKIAPIGQNGELNAYLARLASMENCALEGTMDTGSLSYGRYCFKRDTLLAGIKELNLYPNAEPQELDNFLGDTETQEKIILSWIEKDPKILEDQFKTTVVKRGLGLPEL